MDEMKNNGMSSGDDQEMTGDLSKTTEDTAEITEPEKQSHAVEKTVPTKEQKYCLKCNAEILPGQEFCPKCGTKVGSPNDESGLQKPAAKKKLPVIIGAVVGIIALVAVVLFVRGVQAKTVTLNKDSLTIKVGESAKLKYTIDPDNTKNKTVSWTSSNDSIASVSDGKITAVNEGDCTITITTKNGKTDTCSIVVEPAGPDLKAIYKEFCKSSFSNIASDGSYLSIDTNPYDIDDYSDSEAILAILSVNEALEFPESVINKMSSTRALDGMQTYTGNGIEVSWTYHPDRGLEIMYSLSN